MKKAVIFISILFLISMVFAIELNDYAGTGYSSPRDIYAGDELIFTITPESVHLTDSQSVNIDVVVEQDGGYIYKKAYYFDSRRNEWVNFNFTETTVGGDKWIPDRASRSLTINATNNLLNSPDLNPIVAYSCKKYNLVWRCGCVNTEGDCNHWMLQLLNVSGITSPAISRGCIMNSDCEAGEVCLENTCYASGNSCSASADCEEDERCLYGVCVNDVISGGEDDDGTGAGEGGSSCTNNSECNGEVCINGTCVGINDDCKNNYPDGTLCSGGVKFGDNRVFYKGNFSNNHYLQAYQTCEQMGDVLNLSTGQTTKFISNYTNWRLPTMGEAMTLVYSGRQAYWPEIKYLPDLYVGRGIWTLGNCMAIYKGGGVCPQPEQADHYYACVREF